MAADRLTAVQKATLIRRHLDDGVPLIRLAEQADAPIRTVRRWAAVYRAGGNVAALERRTRSDRGHRRLPDELVEAIEALALRRPPPTAAYIHRRVSDLARDRDLPTPSYTTVRTVIAAIDPGLRTLALHGDAAYRDRFELVYRRSASRPNEQWQADHTLLDVMLLDHRGQPARPWLSLVVDDYSRAVAGFTLFFEAPSAERTALALHQAVSRKANPAWPLQGLPDVLYSDHGSDFTSGRLERVCLDTHIQLIHSRIGVPQGRGKVERLFRTVTTELLPHLPGYVPHGTGGQPTCPPRLTLAGLDAALERYLVEDYHARPHSQTGQPPAQRWLAHGWIPRAPAHPEDLDLLLLTAATTRIVQRDGIQFAGTRYISPVLAAYVGETVVVRHDPRDAAEIRLYHHDDYLCRAVAPELSTNTVTLEELQTARAAQRRALKQQLRERRSLADALPDDARHAPAPPAGTAPLSRQPGAAVAVPLPRHRLRTYASD